MKRLDEAKQPGWTSDLREDFKEAIPTDKVESLRQVFVRSLLLFHAFFLKLPEREHYVDGGPVGSEPALGFGVDSLLEPGAS